MNAESGIINFSPVGFRLAARDFLRCASAFKPAAFSIIPYFLYCRAIELGLKALHLEARRQAKVRRDFGRDLVASYNELPKPQRTLSAEDIALLSQANELYIRKAFEYVQPGDAANGLVHSPTLMESRDLRLVWRSGEVYEIESTAYSCIALSA